MKNPLVLIILIIILGPFFVFAQPPTIDTKPIEAPPSPQCCKLKHKIKWGALECGPGLDCQWVGAVDPDNPTQCLSCPGAGIGEEEVTDLVALIAKAQLAGSTGTCQPDPNWAGYCAVDAIASVGDIVKYTAMIAVGVALLVAAVMFITAAGSPERVSKAKKIFLYSLIGVLIATLAHFMPGLVRFFLGI